MAHVTLDTSGIHDWDSFHEVSKSTFGSPDFYGRNMNAWGDGLTYLDEGDGMSNINLGPDELLHIHLLHSAEFSSALPDVWNEFLSCVAFTNRRYIEREVFPRLSVILE
ncbi:barstar family protein [Deinococcus sonorensis]|uniref:Barstar family protein n=2 Tax=Deinococcus sonorensis TaxID=309891 RepID=A0AAU7UAJ9_9DEIO